MSPNINRSQGLIESDFFRIAKNGFGDPCNAYPHSMEWFNNYLYVGTTRGNLAHAGKQREIKNNVESLEIWPVPIPKNPYDIDLRAEIWRFDPRLRKWICVFASPWVIGQDGYEVPMSIGFRTMAVYQGLSDTSPAIYTPTWGSHQTPYTTLLKCTDGNSFFVASEKGMGLSDPKPRALRGFITFKNKLFMSPGMGQKRREANIAGDMVVMVSEDPAKDKWNYACQIDFGNPNNLTAFELAVFNDHLYAGTLNVNEGFEIWKTRAEGQPPYEWKPVLKKGAYRGRLNQVAMTFCEFKGHLYVGTAIQGGGYDPVNQVGPAPPEIIRITPDDSWELVVDEPRNTPDGLKVPLSDLGPGYNNVFAGYHWAMEVHEGWLYVGNSVWTLFTKYLKDGTHLPESTRETLKYIDRDSMYDMYGGCQLWRTNDGHRWQPVTLNGFGNYYNMGIRTMKSTPYGLFVGTTNPFGPEVAVKRVSGWKYEYNPVGGLEVWLGSCGEFNKQPTEIQTRDIQLSYPPDCSCQPMEHSISIDIDEEDESHKLLKKIYHPGEFRHIGFWNQEIKTGHAACQNLVDELLSLVSKEHDTWVDIGCGSGATTQYIAKKNPNKKILGLTENKNTLQKCRNIAPDLEFKISKPPLVKIESCYIDCALWLRGERDLGSRKKLLSEAFRVLKPGGELVFFDFLASPSIGTSNAQPLWSCESGFPSLESVQSWMQQTGFINILLHDVTYQALEGVKRYIELQLRTFQLIGDYPQEDIERFRSQVSMASVQIDKCIIGYAMKP